MSEQDREQRGFSLLELLVAMVVTLVITGAVFQLLSAGKGVFRKEPAVSTRQQNIRVGMDLIWNDVLGAGSGLPNFSQAFTDGLNGIGPPGPGGVNADELEIISTAECAPLSVCPVGGSGGFTGSSVTVWEPLSSCYQFPALVVLSNPDEMGIFWAEQPGPGGASACSASGGGGGGGGSNGHVLLPHGSNYRNPPGGLHGTWTNPPQWMAVIRAIRYRVTPDAEGVPTLWRSNFGGLDLPNGQSSWEPVAWGVEDLQVQYLNGVGWSDTPGVTTAANTNSVVRRVRIGLSARAMALNLTGQSTSAVGDAVRGQLVSEATPRTAMSSLELAGVGAY